MSDKNAKKRAIKVISNTDLESISTKNAYAQCLKQYYQWCDINEISSDKQSNFAYLKIYLEEKSEDFRQKTLDQHRMALGKAFRKSIPKVTSLIDTVLEARDYLESEVYESIKGVNYKNALSILICFFAGLRAHELATLRRVDEESRSSTRKWSDRLFDFECDYTVYVVTGKGGLRRHVAIPNILAFELESLRYEIPKKVSDRGINYLSYYAIGFGAALSASFTRASKKTLHRSTGVHGLRHAYAKNRMKKLLAQKVNIDLCRLIVSQELGHFRPAITNCYFR